MVNLSRRDADVALRPSQEPPDHLFGRKIAKIVFAPYTSAVRFQGGLENVPAIERQWLGLDDTLAHIPAYRWMADHLPAASVRFRASSLLTLRQACSEGMGAALLPCYMVEPRHGLQRIGPPVAAASSELWLLVHKDIRRTARIRAFLDFAYDELVKLRPRFEAHELA
jgi:DNA-binding transcriptional LysR family regulator